MNQCNCCNTCNAYAYPQMWNKFPPCKNQNEQVKTNLINGFGYVIINIII